MADPHAPLRVMVFGDSLTWGAVPVPHVVPTTRHPAGDRWPPLLEAALTPHLEVVEEGLGGRTTNVDDPLDPRLNGAQVLPVLLASHTPLDLVILLLGTNDLKVYFDRQPFDIAVGVLELIGAAKAAGSQVGTTYPAPDVLVVAPPTLSEIPDPWHQRLFAGAGPKTVALAPALADAAASAGVMFFDSGSTTRTSGSDGIHLTAADNADLARGVADYLSVNWELLRKRL